MLLLTVAVVVSCVACAQAYIDATPPEVVAQCSRTSIEEVVLDMEAGALMRDAFLVFVFRKLPSLSRSVARPVSLTWKASLHFSITHPGRARGSDRQMVLRGADHEMPRVLGGSQEQ